MVATSSHSSTPASDGPVLGVAHPHYVDAKPAIPEYSAVRLYPTQTRFVTGIARAYDDDFPPQLHGLVARDDFETAINQINNTMKDYWPCFFCMCCGYLCCPCTLGVSLLCPNLCIKDAEQYVRALIQRINKRPCFAKAGVEWHLHRSCGRSWIEIEYPITSKPIVAPISYQLGLAPSVTTARTATNGPPAASARSTASSPLIADV